jgi:hypothetical protein
MLNSLRVAMDKSQFLFNWFLLLLKLNLCVHNFKFIFQQKKISIKFKIAGNFPQFFVTASAILDSELNIIRVEKKTKQNETKSKTTPKKSFSFPFFVCINYSMATLLGNHLGKSLQLLGVCVCVCERVCIVATLSHKFCQCMCVLGSVFCYISVCLSVLGVYIVGFKACFFIL